MKFELTEVWGFEHALRGMRNPLESWDKSDSSVKHYCDSPSYDEKGHLCDCWVDESCTYDACGNSCFWVHKFFIGKNDLELTQKLIEGGCEHRKFLRQIFVSVDITAPLYWWKEFDTYKVGTVANSTSTMHKLASTPITLDCFETDNVKILEKFNYEISCWWSELISWLEKLRVQYNETKDKRYWKELIRLLPESWLQKRTITMSYENVFKMVKERSNHKLTEWSVSFIEWAKSLPYADELIFIDYSYNK